MRNFLIFFARRTNTQQRSSAKMHTNLKILTKTNIKGIIPIEMFAKLASKSPETWISDLKKGCMMILAENKRNSLISYKI